MLTTSFQLPDQLRRRVRVAAASRGESSAEYTRRALCILLEADAKHDPRIGMLLRGIDTLDIQDEAERLTA